MTRADPQQERQDGLLAVLCMLVAQLLALMRGRGRPREVVRSMAVLERSLALALFGGGLRADAAFRALPHEQQRAQRHAFTRDYLDLRLMRLRGQRLATVLGRGYRRTPTLMAAIRFERRIASRRVRRLGRARVRAVAATREALSGTPP